MRQVVNTILVFDHGDKSVNDIRLLLPSKRTHLHLPVSCRLRSLHKEKDWPFQILYQTRLFFDHFG
jgi:hypothetical protein